MKVDPQILALLILICSSVFVVAWTFDAYTHAGIARRDISDQELKTHRILILSSGMLQFTVLLFYWFEMISNMTNEFYFSGQLFYSFKNNFHGFQ